MPVYGSCAGMIMLADRDPRRPPPTSETFGGIEMTVRRNAFGRQVDSFEAPIVDFDGVGATVPRGLHPRPLGRAGRRRGRGAGRVTDGPAAGRIVAVRQGDLLATSFHPELTGDLACTRTSADDRRVRAPR